MKGTCIWSIWFESICDLTRALALSMSLEKVDGRKYTNINLSMHKYKIHGMNKDEKII